MSTGISHSASIALLLYYFAKPFIPRSLQRAVRRKRCEIRLRQNSASWPIDGSVGKKPPEWIGWPDSKQFTLVLTHDVDSLLGQSKCLKLAALEEQYGFRSSFGFVARSYQDKPELRRILSDRGFEINLHGLYHNGLMYLSRSIFKLYARHINRYIREWCIDGFRSPSMFHNLDWIGDLNILYDSSTFDTDPFEPQPDRLGTIFPLWIQHNSTGSGYVELPYTLPQDFTLFIMLREKSIDIWKRKLDWVAEQGGMALLLTHPDYMNFGDGKCGPEEYSASQYAELLGYIREKYSGCYWHALPREVAHFWRELYGLQKSEIK